MKWSLRLGRFFGIDLYLHVTFLIFLGLIWYFTRHSLTTLAFFISAFTCVVLHEYGHALAARRYGIPTKDITLLPIGGVARLERIPSDPGQELVVALAGPAVNVVIAAVLYVIIRLLYPGHLPDAEPALHGRTGLIFTLMWWNLMMIAFNMLPAFPMDGGRVLRALLAMKLEYSRATRCAAATGKVMALLFAGYAIFFSGSPMLIVIAFFVWMGASDEAAAASQKALLSGVRVRDAMLVEFRHTTPEETAGTLARLILQSWQTDFPVLFEGKIAGLVTSRDVITGLNTGPSTPVHTFMRHPVPACAPDESLEQVIDRMREAELPLLPVVDDGRLVGLVTPENTVEFMLIRRALSNPSG